MSNAEEHGNAAEENGSADKEASEVEDESSGDGGDVFTVEKIISHKKERGKYKFRIRWLRYEPDDDTWEPEENLIGNYCQRMLAQYKEKHGLLNEQEDEDDIAKRKPHYEYVEEALDEDGNEKKAWFVTGTEKAREIKNLFVHDRILDDTEKALTDLQDAGGRLTRSQRRMIFSPHKKDEKKTETKQKAKKRKRKLKEKPTSVKKKKSQPKKRRSKTKPKQDKRIEESDSSNLSISDEDDSFKSSDNEETDSVITVESDKPTPPPKKPKLVEESPSTPQPQPRVSMVGKDPKQAVPAKPILYNSPLASFRIPKKTSVVVAPNEPSTSRQFFPVKSTAKKFEANRPGFSNMPKRPPNFQNEQPAAPVEAFTPKQLKSELSNKNQLQIHKQEQKQSTNTAAASRPIHWQTARDTIQEKECALPGTRYVIVATLNISPAQLTSYGLLATDPPPSTNEKVLQNTFNENVLSAKILPVRSALRIKAHGLDLNFMDSKGRTLLHRLAEATCDQQHTHDELLDVLVNAGADLTIVDTDFLRTPLHSAVFCRRLCHLRKLVQLGSPINTEDFNKESPLITALKMNNAEIAKILLSAGATFQSAFENKINLSKNQLKPVASYQHVLQEAMKNARRSVFVDFQNASFTLPTFQAPLYESHEITFTMFVKPDLDISHLFTILMLALVDPAEPRMRAVSWGELPVENVFLNGNELEVVHQGNRFFYVTPPLSQQNNVTINLDESRTKYSKRILVAQLFGIDPTAAVPRMQPTLQAFFSGQVAEARPKQQQQKRSTVTEVYFGQAFRDDATETAALICNFLDAFYHQIVCIYGRYPAENIKSSSFNGVLTKRCTDKKVVEYFQLSRPTLRRWLLHQQVRSFVVVLLAPENEIVAEFRVNFYEPKIGMKKFVHDFDTEIEQLNQQLRQALISLQTSPELQFVCDLPLAPSFQIHIHSNGELEEQQTSTEHEWTNADLSSQIGTLHTNNSQRVSCPLGEMRFNYISFEPIDPKDIHEIEHEKSPSPQNSSNSSDIIVLD